MSCYVISNEYYYRSLKYTFGMEKKNVDFIFILTFNNSDNAQTV